MELSFINVGYGDAILIESSGFTMLLDGGSALPQEFDGYSHRIRAADYLKRMGISQVDLLLMSHIHEDHICGVEAVLTQIPVGKIYIPYDPALFAWERAFTLHDAPRNVHLFSTALCAMVRMLESAKERCIPVNLIQAGDRLTLPGGTELSVLAPAEDVRKNFECLIAQAFTEQNPTSTLTELDCISNASSLLIKLLHDDIGVLLAADNCMEDWNLEDVSMLRNVNVLKLPHHGQRDSIDEEIIREMSLTHVITTASSDRRYDSANPEVYDRLLQLNPEMTLLFTDEREYSPYFKNPDGANAVKLVINSGGIQTEFIK